MFNVNFEGGATKIVGRDFVALAPGSMTAYRSSHTVVVTGGNLDIDFAGTVDQPSVAAIEVIPGTGQASALATAGVQPAATPPAGGVGTGTAPALAAPAGTGGTSAAAPGATGTTFRAQSIVPSTLLAARSAVAGPLGGIVGPLAAGLPTLTAPSGTSFIDEDLRAASPQGAARSTAGPVTPDPLQQSVLSFDKGQLVLRPDVAGALLLLLLLGSLVAARRLGVIARVARAMQIPLLVRGHSRP